MSYWKWEPAFSVGIAVIDDQHKQMIAYINELGTISIYHDNEKVRTVLLALMDYTVSHLAFEERLMEEAGYPKLEAHKQIHLSFIERIHFFQERYENGEDISKQLMMDLQMWLINHIQHDDTDYKEVVQAMLHKKEAQMNGGWLTTLIDKFFK
ncbi:MULTISPECIES: bacteriohemerythrin [unclassified Sulfurospirillum]|uniref:bacteriohemerythrin n=1 Tax=unclassified Sulfurospirillum TaxID=2618290 RepID=UPI0005022D2E|nr:MULTISPECIES: bacteriohemerythrin [unclassified Sulfurospirillum]KFL34427.1 hypothetical protein JU57_05255 [Sulfurospirillum sp. SCADC]